MLLQEAFQLVKNLVQQCHTRWVPCFCKKLSSWLRISSRGPSSPVPVGALSKSGRSCEVVLRPRLLSKLSALPCASGLRCCACSVVPSLSGGRQLPVTHTESSLVRTHTVMSALAVCAVCSECVCTLLALTCMHGLRSSHWQRPEARSAPASHCWSVEAELWRATVTRISPAWGCHLDKTRQQITTVQPAWLIR